MQTCWVGHLAVIPSHDQPCSASFGRAHSGLFLFSLLNKLATCGCRVVQELVARLQGYGSLFTVRHTHTLGGHEGPVPGAAASAGRSVGGPGIVVTSGFDGLTNIWRPSVCPGAPVFPSLRPCASCAGRSLSKGCRRLRMCPGMSQGCPHRYVTKISEMCKRAMYQTNRASFLGKEGGAAGTSRCRRMCTRTFTSTA